MRLAPLMPILLITTPAWGAGESWFYATSQYGLISGDFSGVYPTCPTLRDWCIEQRMYTSLALGASPRAGLQVEGHLGWDWSSGELPQPTLSGVYGKKGKLHLGLMQVTWSPPDRHWKLELGRLLGWNSDPILWDGMRSTWAHPGLSDRGQWELAWWGGVPHTPEATLGILQSTGEGTDTSPEGSVSPLLGSEIQWRYNWRTTLKVGDDFYADRHHSYFYLRQTLTENLHVMARARALDVNPRDMVVGLDWVQPTHLSQLQWRYQWESAFVLGPDIYTTSRQPDRLLLGPRQSGVSAEFYHQQTWKNWLPSVYGQWLTPADLSQVSAFLRPTLTLGMEIERVQGDHASLRAGWESTWQTGVGQFSGTSQVPGQDIGEPTLFVDLSGQGMSHINNVSMEAKLAIRENVDAQLGADLRVIRHYQSAYVEVDQWESFFTHAGVYWSPGDIASVRAWYSYERDLYSLYGTTPDLHHLNLALTFWR